MSDLNSIGESLNDLWKNVLAFGKSKGAIWSVLLGMGGYGTYWLSSVDKYAHSIAVLPEYIDRVDSLTVELGVMHEILKADTAAYNMYFDEMKSFFDTLPGLYKHAETYKTAFIAVQRSIKKIDSIQHDRDKKFYLMEKMLDGSIRSTRVPTM